MKLIFLTLLISFTASAQYRVEVFKKGELSNRGEFETLEEATAWKEKGLKSNWFGRPEIKETVCEDGMLFGENCKEVIKQEAEPFEIVGPFDISSERNAEKEKQERKKLAKERIKNFDLSKIDSATTIKGLREVVKELMIEIIEANE